MNVLLAVSKGVQEVLDTYVCKGGAFRIESRFCKSGTLITASSLKTIYPSVFAIFYLSVFITLFADFASVGPHLLLPEERSLIDYKEVIFHLI